MEACGGGVVVCGGVWRCCSGVWRCVVVCVCVCVCACTSVCLWGALRVCKSKYMCAAATAVRISIPPYSCRSQCTRVYYMTGSMRSLSTAHNCCTFTFILSQQSILSEHFQTIDFCLHHPSSCLPRALTEN